LVKHFVLRRYFYDSARPRVARGGFHTCYPSPCEPYSTSPPRLRPIASVSNVRPDTHTFSRLEAVYGDRLSRVVLYGSRVRGDGRRPDPDYDIAVFLLDR
jgi:hypothetical protein